MTWPDLTLGPCSGLPVCGGGAAAAEPMKKKRMSVDAAQLSIPVLQGKIKMALGPNAKLPKKKPDLLAMYLKHCEH